MAASQLQGLFSTVVYEYSPNPSQLQGLFSTVVYEYSPNPSQLQGLFSTTVYDAGPNISDITGSTAATASFAAAVGGLDRSVWTWTSIPGGSSIANSQIAFPDNKATTPINMSGNVGLYHFEGNANDSSGEGTNGTVTSATQVTGRVGSHAYNFDGTDDLINFGSKFQFTTGDFSFSLWMKPDSTQNAWAMVFGTHGNYNGYALQQRDGNTNRYRLQSANGSAYSANDTDFLLTADVWSHVVITRSGTITKGYVNGSHVYTDVAVTTIQNALNFHIGKYPETGWSSFWNGVIDEFAVWSRKLSSVEIKNIYLAQSGSVAGTGNTLSFVPDVVGTYTVKFETGLVSGSADAVISAVVSGPDGISKIISISKDNIGSILGISYGDIDKINDID